MKRVDMGMRALLATELFGIDLVKQFRQDFALHAMRESRGLQKRQRVSTLHATNGKRECARRRRQIAAGSLKVANGLCLEGAK